MSDQPAETVEPRRCGNCRWVCDGKFVGMFLTCSSIKSPNLFAPVKITDTCDAWQQRGAE